MISFIKAIFFREKSIRAHPLKQDMIEFQRTQEKGPKKKLEVFLSDRHRAFMKQEARRRQMTMAEMVRMWIEAEMRKQS